MERRARIERKRDGPTGNTQTLEKTYMANLGFVGLGVMGGNMVARFLEQGHTVTGYNRTKSKAQWLIDKGMKWADSPRAVAEAADVTFSMVTNSAALTEVFEGPNGVLAGLSAGKHYIDMSTVNPAVSRKMADKTREKEIGRAHV